MTTTMTTTITRTTTTAGTACTYDHERHGYPDGHRGISRYYQPRPPWADDAHHTARALYRPQDERHDTAHARASARAHRAEMHARGYAGHYTSAPTYPRTVPDPHPCRALSPDEVMSMMPGPVATISVDGGRWSLVYPRPDKPGPLGGSTSLSGYGPDVFSSVPNRVPDPEHTPCFDLRTAEYDAAAHLSISGPMHSPDLPAGMVSALGIGTVPHDPAGPRDQGDTEPGPFGNAGSFDTVAMDVYTRYALAAGIRVTTVADILRRPGSSA